MLHRGDAFPAGLYGMLLVAAFGVALPALLAPIERVVMAGAAFVPRTIGGFLGEPAAAADGGRIARIAELQADLLARVQAHDADGSARFMPAGLEPVVCTVVAVERHGGGGQPSMLRLERSYRELAGYGDFVTKGAALIGVLLQPGRGLASKDGPDDRARVLLWNDASSRRLASAMQLDGGGSLRMVVGPAARVDPAPLRAELWDDPYRASRLRGGGRSVVTLELPGIDGQPPGGLLLGTTKIWGYQAVDAEESVTIGVFVEPPFAPRALSHVVVWRPVGVPPPPPEPTLAEHAVTLWQLPGAQNRHVLAGSVAVPDGAAVVQDGVCVGTARGLAFGFGLVTAFAATHTPWSLILVPDAAGEAPREFVGVVVGGGGGMARLRCTLTNGQASGLGAGSLFTGSNGGSCPPGLYLGRAVAGVDGADLVVALPSVPETCTASLFVGEDPR